MREIFTTKSALAAGMTEAELKWGQRTGRWRRVVHGVYGRGPDDPSQLDRAVALVVRSAVPARGRLAGVLHRLDSVKLAGPQALRRGTLEPGRVIAVEGIPCVDGLQTMVDLAACLSDAHWEQALESALRQELVTVANLEAVLPELGRSRTPGAARIRRVLHLRPPGAPPTGSLLETLMVQLLRTMPDIPPPVRQYRVDYVDGRLVAFVDLAWPELGLFIELDGQQHKHQPVYDASRETAVVAATGWLCGRFTWYEVVHCPQATKRRIRALVAQARCRPLAAG